MANASSTEVRPTAALRRAVVEAVVGFLKGRPVLRAFLGIVGAILFVIGGLLAPFWGVPLLSWLTAGQVAAPCLAAGLGALGIWYLSGQASAQPGDAASGPGDAAEPAGRGK